MIDLPLDEISDLTLKVFELNGLILDIGDVFLKPLGLSSAKWQVLGATALAPSPLSVAHIAKKIGQSRQATQKTANYLVENGFAIFAENQFHKRSNLLLLTEKGSAAHVAAMAAWMPLASSIKSQIRASTIAQLSINLTELTAILRLQEQEVLNQ